MQSLFDLVDEAVSQTVAELLEINPLTADVGVEVIAAPERLHAARRMDRRLCFRRARASRFILAAQFFSSGRIGLSRLFSNSSSSSAGANSRSSSNRRPARSTSLSF